MKHKLQTSLFYFAAAALFFCFLSLWLRKSFLQFGVDDANIFFTYAQNILNGEGFVWTPGGRRVEGVSSLGWLAVCMLAYLASPGFELLLFLASFILLTISFLFYFRSLERLKEEGLTLSPIYWAAFILANPGFLIWNIFSLMDVVLWTSSILVLAASLSSFILKDKSKLILLAVLAFLPFVRTEGVGIAWLSVFLVQFLKSKDSSFKIYPLVLVCLISQLVLFVSRFQYFGFWLPNTYFAKVGSSFSESLAHGWNYFLSFGMAFPLVFLALLLSVLFLLKAIGAKSVTSKQTLVVINGTLFLSAVVGYVFIGGDHFKLHRFYQAFWPLVFPILVFGLGSLFSWPRKETIAASLVIINLLFGIGHWQSLVNPRGIWLEFHLAKQGREIGEFLNTKFPEEKPRVGAIVVGGLGFSYEGEVIDLMGLNSVEMAHAEGERSGIVGHSAFNLEIFRKLSPDILLYRFYPCTESSAAKWFEHRGYYWNLLKDLFKNSEVMAEYEPVLLKSSASEEGVCAFASKQFVLKNSLPLLKLAE